MHASRWQVARVHRAAAARGVLARLLRAGRSSPPFTRGEVPVALPQAARSLGAAGDALVTAVSGGLARIDPYSGRVLWSRRLGQDLDTYATEAGGLIWARSSGRLHDRLQALDPDTGRVLTSLELHDFGGAGIAAIDNELWLSTVGGKVVILRR
jgi:hypothetical protein